MRTHGIPLFLFALTAAASLFTTGAYAHSGHDEEAAASRLMASDKYITLSQQLAEQPSNSACAVKLARLCLDKGSTTLARQALSPWWKMNQVPGGTILLRATILQRDHHFTEALAELSLLLKANPKNADAWLMKSTIHAIIGDYEEAYASALPLFGVASPLIASTATANALSLAGKANESYALLHSRLTKQENNESADVVCWAWTVLAEIALRIGKTEEAMGHFERALEADPGNRYTRATFGDALIENGRALEAWRLIRPSVSGEAETLILALAEKALHKPDPRYSAELREQFASLSETGSRSAARYFLDIADDPAKAWRIAKANWDALQREPADTLLALRAAKAAHEDDSEIRQWLKKSGSEDVRLAVD